MPALDLQYGPTALTALLGRRFETKARTVDKSAWNLACEGLSFHSLTKYTNRQGAQARPDPVEIRNIGDTQNIHKRRDFVPIAIVPGILFEPLPELRGI